MYKNKYKKAKNIYTHIFYNVKEVKYYKELINKIFKKLKITGNYIKTIY